MSRESAVIIGAGPAGRTTAYELGKRGMRSTLLEAADQVGDVFKIISYRGYRFDIGGHRFFSKVPLINQLWREIVGEEFLLRPCLSRIYYNQHFFNYPLKPINALAGLGPAQSLLVALSYVRARLIRHEDERTFEDWVSNRFGYRVYGFFLRPTARRSREFLATRFGPIGQLNGSKIFRSNKLCAMRLLGPARTHTALRLARRGRRPAPPPRSRVMGR